MVAIAAIVVIFFLGGSVGFAFGFWMGTWERKRQEGFPVWPLWPTDVKDKGLPGTSSSREGDTVQNGGAGQGEAGTAEVNEGAGKRE